MPMRVSLFCARRERPRRSRTAEKRDENGVASFDNLGEREQVVGEITPSRTTITAADLLNDRVLPFFEEHDVKLLRVLTDRGSEFCGNPERYEYELYLAVEVRSPLLRIIPGGVTARSVETQVSWPALPHYNARPRNRSRNRLRRWVRAGIWRSGTYLLSASSRRNVATAPFLALSARWLPLADRMHRCAG
jgi:hypothetical protein